MSHQNWTSLGIKAAKQIMSLKLIASQSAYGHEIFEHIIS